MVTYIRSDLEFILQQIKISEAHAAGSPLYGPGGLIPSYNLSFGLRTVDGSSNHLLPGQELWGAANVPFPTLVDPAYRPASAVIDMNGPAPGGLTAPTYAPSNVASSVVVDSSLRTISNLLVDQTLANPAAILEALERAGSVDPFGDLPAITAIYQAFRPASAAEYQARVVKINAQTAATLADNGNPAITTPAETAANSALAAATAAHDVTLANLDTARVVRDAALTPFGLSMEGDNVVLLNTAPDAGLSAPFNSWFTLFGQFFDHGLDLVNKGGSGTVFVPLQPDDPLYVVGSQTNFMVLTRATVSAGADNVMGTADDVRPVNTTTSYVDQNQTYASHASHQVFLRQYELNDAGRPVATGKLIEGGGPAPGGMATWGELKDAALMLGILLTDQDVGKVPLLRTDQYGNFIPNGAGYAQVITGVGNDGIPNTADDVVISGTPTAPVSLTTAIRTNSAFLADIAHTAVPLGIEDGDITIGLANPGNNPLVYDNELLDAHFVAGDGRVNENIGLTAVHHIFHSEHNRLVEHTKEVVLADAAAMLAGGATQADAVAFLNEWLIVDLATVPVGAAAINSLVWDGERLFQAAKFGTEMQYQHLVFEEFARKIQPQVDGFIVPDGFDTTINPDIVAEFAHVVYRFGHSMLTETITRFDSTFSGTTQDISLIDGFLNPIAFDGGQLVPDGFAAGDIIRGMTRQIGNEIDEFVTSALRNNLLGLPLDLATINLARGRDTGVPSLNAARVEFYEATNHDVRLKPYESWVDFAANLKNEASIINFVAAYGTHSLITGQATVEGKRDAALTIISGQSVGGLVVPADSVDFLNATGAFAGGSLGGLNNVDLWIGGLAEKILPFGGMLGSTFNFVFEVQMEQLQNGDRFYYLQRLDGLHLFGELEGNSFASLIMRNSDVTRLPSDVFSTPGLILEVDPTRQFNDLNGDGVLESDDPEGVGLLSQLVIRNNPGTAGTDADYLRYTGDQHVVLGGTEGADILIASEGDDTLHGDGGNDTLEGGAGNDIFNAGSGDDIVNDLGGDDNIKLGDGHDVVNTGPGLDLVLGGRGQDFIVLGNDAGTEVFAGEGNDFVLGNITAERILGNEGDDWIEHGTFDGAPGDNFDEIFAQDGIAGHDVFFGLGGFDEFIAEGGDDIMVGSPGRGVMAGMSGWDWATYKDHVFGVNADLTREIVFDENPTPPANGTLDSYQSVEGLSGTRFNDVLGGSNVTAEERLHFNQGGTEGYRGSALDAAGIARVAGLQAVLGAGVTSFSAGDIILGGDGNDLITGNNGDDIIDGDKWLNVRISVREAVGPNGGVGAEIATANSMTELVSEMFNRTYNPGQLMIVREILTDSTNISGSARNIDTALFRGTRAEYDIEGITVQVNDNGAAADTITYVGSAQDLNGDGYISVTDRDIGDGATVLQVIDGVATEVTLATRGLLIDGSDRVSNIERLQFADMTIIITGPSLDLNAYAVVNSTAQQYRDTFGTAALNNTNGATNWSPTPWVESGDNGNVNSATAGQIQITGGTLQFRDSDTDAGNGTATIQRAVNLADFSTATLSYSVNEVGFDAGELVTVTFSDDGSFSAGHIQTIQTINNNTNNAGTFSAALTGTFTANAAIRFVVSGTNNNNAADIVSIDNVNIATTTVAPGGQPGDNYAATFTENGAPLAIAVLPGIVSAGAVLSARIVLTDWQAGDALSVAGALPAGITASAITNVAGVMTLNLSGSASAAAYQTALGQVRYVNTSANTGDNLRTIEITVTNSTGTSDVATAAITVVAVNDAPAANDDIVVTNSTGAFVIPEWALLANDTDADGPLPLDITAVADNGGANGFAGLSLTTNPGAVTLSDIGTAGGTFTYTANDGNLPVNGTDAATVNVTNQAFTNVGDDFNGLNNTTPSAANNSTGATAWGTSWVEIDDNANIRSGQIQIDAGANPGTNDLRFGVGDGGSLTRGINLSGTSAATLTFNYDKNGIDVGESVQIQFAPDGINFVTLDTLTNGINGNGNAAGTLSLALTGALGANSAIRFVASGINTAGEDIRIDNVAISYALPNAAVTAAGGNQILVGNELGSAFTAGAGDDTVLANGGNDTINWSVGHGRDFIDGGANTAAGDQFIVNGDDSDENFVVYVRAEAIAAGITVFNAATDFVITRNGIGNVVAELDNIENINVFGGAGNDTFNGAAGNDVLNGGAGNDALTGGAGNDIIIGGAGSDVAVFAGVLQNFVFGGADTASVLDSTGAEGALDFFSEVETLRFSGADYAVISGTTGVNTLTGTAANEAIFGFSGNDLINGGGGNDILSGGNGNDTISQVVNEGRDLVDGSTGTDTYILTGDATNEAFVIRSRADAITAGIAAGTLSVGTDYVVTRNATVVAELDNIEEINIVGGAGNDTINGGAGNDVMTGGAGIDTLTGGAGNDVAVFDGVLQNFVFGGADTASVLDSTGAEGALNFFSEVETLRFSGVNYSVINGTTGVNTLTGTAANNAIFGFAGNDLINGGAGNDILSGGGGNDTITQVSNQGRDIVDGSTGTDTYVLNGTAAAETFNIYTRAAWLGLAGNTAGQLNFGTEIVIATGLTNATVIAELDNIEELIVNSLETTAQNGDGIVNGGLAGGDTVNVVGNFNAPATSLAFNTITVNGGPGNEMVNISQLTSAHRLVFNAGTGSDSVVGTIRPQDTINMSANTGAGAQTSGSSIFSPVGQSAQNGTSAGVFHNNPMFERSRAVNLDQIGHEDSYWFTDRAVHVDAADYLIS